MNMLGSTDVSDDLHRLAAPYALDAIDDSAERLSFENHLKSCVICAEAVAQFRETAASVAMGAAVSPPVSLRASVLDSLGSTPQVPAEPRQVIDLTRPRPKLTASRLVLVAMAASVVLIIGVFGILTPRTAPTGLDEIALADDARISETTSDGTTLKIVWSPSMAQAAVTGSQLPILDEGQTYQLWLIADEATRPAGIFTSPDGDLALVVATDGGMAQAWGITIEPAGGSTSPTSDVLYTGTF